MGKTKLLFKTQNKELQTDMEYLLASTGYFDFVAEEAEGVYVIDPEVDSILKKPFSEFLGGILEDTNQEVKSSEALSEGKVKTIAIASLSGEGWSSAIAVILGRLLFKKGYRAAYIGLSPLNTWVSEIEKNEKGFGRLLLDSMKNCPSGVEKYTYDDGEIVFIGAPIFNPNAGDIRIEDIRFLLKILSLSKIDFLIMDIASNLDLDREKIFLAADFPVMGMSTEKTEEAIFHKYFEGALPLIGNDKNIEGDARNLSELIEKRIRGEEDEEEPIWH